MRNVLSGRPELWWALVLALSVLVSVSFVPPITRGRYAGEASSPPVAE